MTTDVAEITETPTLESNDSPTGDADNLIAADAGLTAKEGTATEGLTESTNDGETLAPDLQAALEEAKSTASAAAAEKSAREAREQTEREQSEQNTARLRQQQEQAFRQNYQNRVRESYNEAYQDAIDSGLDESAARLKGEKAAQRFNSHHADGLKLFEPQARQIATQQVYGEVNSAIYEVLGKQDAPKFFGTQDTPINHGSPKEALAALKSIWTEGMKTEAEVKAEVSAAKLGLIAQLEKEGRLTGSSSGDAKTGSTSSGSYRDLEQLNAARTSGRINDETYLKEQNKLLGIS